jgi:hypothetical protein
VKTPIEVYVVKNEAGQVIYVGQTEQSKGYKERFKEHLSKDHPQWKGKNYTPEVVNYGDWTAYEAAVWEQHYIDEYGGLAKNGGKLENKQLGIEKDKYYKYRKLGQTAC